jgi:V-type H+-transporting ATPase subunit d
MRDYRWYAGTHSSTLAQYLDRHADHIPDVKLQLGPAYGDYLASLPPNPSTSALADKAMDKLVAEFRYLQANATGSLARFMEYLTYAYMIDNVALLITGTLHERDTRELLERCHPLGWFETMPALCVATNIEELYNSVLIETPLAPYFKGSLSHQDLDELNIEIVRNTLYKNYLEDFHRFVNEDSEIKGSPTQGVMSEILEFEADRRSINITINSFGTELNKNDRNKLYPNFGRLHPEGTLMLSRADDPEGVRIAVDGVSDYRTMLDQTGMGGSSGGIGNQSGGIGGDEGKSLEDLFYQKEMEISKLAFTFQFTHAIVYAWLRLREQVCQTAWSPKRYQNELTNNFFTGNPQHHLDLRVHCAKPERQDRQLHLSVLDGLPLYIHLVFSNSCGLCIFVALLGANKKRLLVDL